MTLEPDWLPLLVVVAVAGIALGWRSGYAACDDRKESRVVRDKAIQIEPSED